MRFNSAGGDGGSPVGAEDEQAAVPFLSPAAPLKQNSDALSTFPILLFCVRKCKRERLCEGGGTRDNL